MPALAADLGVSSEALRHWLRQGDVGASRGAYFAWVGISYNRRRAHSVPTHDAPATFAEAVLLLQYPVAKR